MTALLLLCLILCDSPIVPLNNWNLRTCLFYFLLGQHLPILVFFPPLKINCLGNTTRENASGERRVERGGEIRGREREICAHNGDCRYAKYLWFLIRELPLSPPLAHCVTWLK